MTRPKTLSPWASADTYDAPGKSWDGTPTKVEPNEGLTVQGWQPGMAPPAQVENHERASERAMLNYLSAIEIQNWCVEEVTPSVSVDTFAGIARSDDTIWLSAYKQGTTLAPPNNILLRSHNGKAFAPRFGSNPSWFDFHTIRGIAVSDSDHAALFLGPTRDDLPSAVSLAVVPPSGAAPAPVEPFPQAYGVPGAIAWWPAAGRFVAAALLGDSADLSDLAFGVASIKPGEAPELLDNVLGMFGSPELTVFATRPRVHVVPAGDRLAVSFQAYDTTGATLRTLWILYKYAGGVLTKEFTRISEKSEIPAAFVGLVFDTTRAQFVAVGGLRYIGNGDGTWEISAMPSSVRPQSVSGKGDMLVAVHNFSDLADTLGKLAWSTDSGQTWQLDDKPILPRVSGVTVTSLGNQFAMAGIDIGMGSGGTGDVEIAYSLRLK